MSVRYGLIGCGMMGREHLCNLAAIDGTRVTALADPVQEMREQALREADGAVPFADHRDLLASGLVDALIVASPNHTHAPVLEDVLAGDLPVLVEKPLCTTSLDCRRIEAMARDRGAPVWVAMEYRYMPPIARLIEEVRQGTAGRPRMLAIREHRFPFLRKVGDWNRFARNTGGTLVEKCCHFFDLMRLVLQAEPVRVHASGAQDVNHLDECYGGERPDIIDNAFVIVEFDNGTRAMLDLCMFAEASRDQEEIALTGDAGKIECGIPSSTLVIGRRAPVERMGESLPLHRETLAVDPAIRALGDHHGSTYFQHRRFLEMLRSGGRPEVTVHDGAMAVAMGEAGERSIRERRPIDL
ncbi:MAG: Gfo/Idh/MocA family oxidoreductase [Geminicoccaceae bacterium]